MSTAQLSHSANQSPAAAPAPEAPQPLMGSGPGGRPAGILPMPAQMLASRQGGAPDSVAPAAAAGGGGTGAGGQQDSAGRGSLPTTGGGDNAAEGPLLKDPTNMANTKEKTPMCLLNELARYHKHQPKYELINEKGPPHEKIFTVRLTLDGKAYESSGPSIKKAQHAAAAIALEKCGLTHPIPRNMPPKFKRKNPTPNTDALTPTVKLNSLAMKIAKQVQYFPLNPMPPRPFYGPGGYRGPRNPHPNHQQGMQGGQHPPNFHPPGPPQMPPQGLNQQQGPGGPPPGLAAPKGMSPPPGQGNNQSPDQQQQQQGGSPPLHNNQGQQQQQHPQNQGGPPYHPNNQQRPFYQRFPRPYIHFVKVMIGDREFVGEGKTQKAARQNAACRALAAMEGETPALKVDQATTTNVPSEGNGDATTNGGDEKNGKSDISLVYEAANLHDLNVVFKMLEEKGQPHLKIFKLQCVVGEFVTEATGSSKKDAKRNAAELMLPKLKGLPPVPPKMIAQHHRQRQLWRHDNNKKKKSKSLLKTPPEDPNFGAPGLHPVSRLVQILQAKNEREPEFSVIEERPLMERAGPHMVRRREFTIQVAAASKTATGKGKTKKDAKKVAAENMLKLLGYAPTPEETNGTHRAGAQPTKSALKTAAKPTDESDRKVTFKEDPQKAGVKKEEAKDGSPPTGHSGKALAPGLLPMMPGVTQQQPQMFPSGPAPPSAHKLPGQGLNRAPGAPISGANSKVAPGGNQALSDIARDLLSLGHSPTAEALLKGTSGPHAIPNLSRPSQQLEYLAKVSALSIKFNDFPKGSRQEYQSVVYINTEPQSAFRGTGNTIESAHDIAAITALRALAGITDSEGGKKAGGQ